MKPDTKKKAKQIGFIAMVCVATITAINSLAKRNKTAAAVRDKIHSGV